MGKPATYVMLFVVFVACGYALWLSRGPLLAVDYGTNLWLWAPGMAFYLCALRIQAKIRRQLTFKVLAGVPELDADGKGGKLLDTGLYARVRHPRYLAVTLGQIAWAFFTNYLAMYALIPIIALGLAAIAWFEERELEERFGQAYVEYRRARPHDHPAFPNGLISRRAPPATSRSSPPGTRHGGVAAMRGRRPICRRPCGAA